MKPPEATKNVPTQSHPLSPHFFESEERGRFLAWGAMRGPSTCLKWGDRMPQNRNFSVDALMMHDKY